MATRTGIRVDHDNGVTTITWTGLAAATSDVGSLVDVGDLENLTAQASGTNTNTVALQGTNLNNASAASALGAGVTLTIGSNGYSPPLAVSPQPRFIRPTTPSANSVNVVVSGRRKR